LEELFCRKELKGRAMSALIGEGKPSDIPHWRTLKAERFLNAKYLGGIKIYEELLEGAGPK
jgi:hypothetical protein